MINDKIIRRYIEQQGEQPDGRYLLKDTGAGEFIAKWEYQFAKPTNAQIATIVSELDLKETMRNWQKQMDAILLSDDLENIIDALDAPTRARILDETLDKYNAKKALRLSKP